MVKQPVNREQARLAETTVSRDVRREHSVGWRKLLEKVGSLIYVRKSLEYALNGHCVRCDKENISPVVCLTVHAYSECTMVSQAQVLIENYAGSTPVAHPKFKETLCTSSGL